MKKMLITLVMVIAMLTPAYAIEVVMPVKVKEIVYERDNTMTLVVTNKEGDTFMFDRVDIPENLFQQMYMCFDLVFVSGTKWIMDEVYLTTKPKK